jgi:glycosyltransferase involved in cell wall biosynthesis
MNEKQEIKASVIIPTYNRSRSLLKALTSLALLDFSQGQWEVVVVDNHCTDDTKQIVELAIGELGLNIKYVREDRLSFTVARHTGATAASGNFLLYIDDDVVVDRGWLGGVVEIFESDKTVGIVGGPILPTFEIEPPVWISKYYPMSGWLSLLDLGVNIHENKYAYGPNFSVRKDILKKVGGFPADTIGVEAEGRPNVVEKIYVGSGDVGLCAKVIKAGYKIIYTPKALVHHVIPPVRLTKKWWHSRFAGEGCYHAITQQYENNYNSVNLFWRGIASYGRSVPWMIKYAISAMMGAGKEKYEFMISYFLSNARVSLVLAKRPYLAKRLWEVALSGVLPQDIADLIRLVP